MDKTEKQEMVDKLALFSEMCVVPMLDRKDRICKMGVMKTISPETKLDPVMFILQLQMVADFLRSYNQNNAQYNSHEYLEFQQGYIQKQQAEICKISYFIDNFKQT